MAATGHRDDVGAEKESVEDGSGGGHIAEEFAPVFDWGGSSGYRGGGVSPLLRGQALRVAGAAGTLISAWLLRKRPKILFSC